MCVCVWGGGGGGGTVYSTVDDPRRLGTLYSVMDGPRGPSILLWMVWGPTETQFGLELCMPFKSDMILCHTQLPSYPGFFSPCP